MKQAKSFYHRRPIVASAGKHQEKTDCNISTHQEKTNRNVGNPYSSWWPEEEEVAVTVDVAASMVDMVTEEDRTTLEPGWWLSVVSVLHLVLMCLIMDTGQLQIRWELHGKARPVCGHKLWTGQAMSYRTRFPWYFLNQSILRKSWLNMPFENRWFELAKTTYNGPTYWSESSWKLQPHLELTQMHQCNLQFWIMKLQKEITNKTMRSQSKCWIQKRCNTATIGEPTKRGMHYWQNTEGRHSLSSLASALNYFKTNCSRILIGIQQAHHTTLWNCIGWSRKWLLRRRRINNRLPPCMIRSLVFTHFGRRQCPTRNGTKNSTQRLMLDWLSV